MLTLSCYGKWQPWAQKSKEEEGGLFKYERFKMDCHCLDWGGTQNFSKGQKVAERLPWPATGSHLVKWKETHQSRDLLSPRWMWGDIRAKHPCQVSIQQFNMPPHPPNPRATKPWRKRPYEGPITDGELQEAFKQDISPARLNTWLRLVLCWPATARRREGNSDKWLRMDRARNPKIGG